MKIIDYRNISDITVEFQDNFKYRKNTTYANFLKGVKNPYDKSIYGLACIGVGEYFSFIDNMITPEYSVWNAILQRCYDEGTRAKSMSYMGCSVCNEWHNYQNFARWYHENYYDVGDGKRMHIDKDILKPGNKIYSPETCIFVPQRINMIFLKHHKTKDKDLPNAVYRCANGFRASYNGKSLGVFSSAELAIAAHTVAMRKNIKKISDDYKDRLPTNVYSALINW